MIFDNKFTNDVNNELNSSCKVTREAIKHVIDDPLFVPVFDMSIRKQKDLALTRLQKVISKKLVSVKDFRTNPDNIFTMHEMLGFVDGSLATKFTVQFNLFGGTLIALGTKKHESFLDKLDSLNVIGCFCLTELGYGNNAVEMETTATFDPIKKQFIINCPTIQSQKFWITNGAYHANFAAVFAKTIVKGKDEGINTFLIRIRNDDGSLVDGVVIDDMGHKMGLNGIDNARIIFKNVPASPDSLLDKISSLNPETGEFSSIIKGRRARFIYAANRLLSGRLCIASMIISSTKVVLANTIRYSKSRLSNGKSGKSDTAIFNYQLFQNQIIPLLVKTLIYNIGLLKIRQFYSSYILNEEEYIKNSPEKINEVIRLCCCIKPIICWHGNQVGNICRERCGGQGYLSINMVEVNIYSAHSGITAEGDSVVLMQKVSKEYVEDFAKGLIEIPYSDYDDNTTKEKFNKIVDAESLLQLNHISDLIRVRESSLLSSLTEKTVSNQKEIYETWMLKESDLIQDLAMTYGKRYCLEQFVKCDLMRSQ